MRTESGMQHLLDRAKWDCNGARDASRTYVWGTLAEPNAVLVIDETGLLKKGIKSVGVQRFTAPCTCFVCRIMSTTPFMRRGMLF